MIELVNVSKSHRTPEGEAVPILSEVSLRVDAGEFVAITGPSGCGKTTLLNLIGALDRDFTGDIRIAGQDIRRLSDRQLSAFRNKTVGFVFQQFNLLAPLSALENVLLPSHFDPSGEPRTALRERAQKALERVGLGEKLSRRPAQLSGGERQRVAIARALFARPRLVLCDEPTGNLDARTGQAIIDLFRELVAEQAMTLVVVTHETRLSQAAGRVVTLSDHRLRPVDTAAAPRQAT
ncbi:MAG: ABC transporter ATP-binding protein [Myxococcaceae bacterium]|nr:ABC transporter ATP-binding protein [Myxococcaceae bacterium]